MATLDISNGNWGFNDANTNGVARSDVIQPTLPAMRCLYTVTGGLRHGGATVGVVVSGSVAEQQGTVEEWRDARVTALKAELVGGGAVEDGNGAKYVFGVLGPGFYFPPDKCTCISIQPINWLGGGTPTVVVEGFHTPYSDPGSAGNKAEALATMVKVVNSLVPPGGNQAPSPDSPSSSPPGKVTT